MMASTAHTFQKRAVKEKSVFGRSVRPGYPERPLEAPEAQNLKEPSVIRVARPNQAGGLEVHETVEGRQPGTRFIRRTRANAQKLRQLADGEFEATQAALA